MIVVTGAPRTGTSLLMQTLDRLGILVAAPAFLPQHYFMKQFNPGGFYEFASEDGIEDHQYKGKAVKLFGGQLVRTPKEFIKKLIWVQRDRKKAIESYEKIRSYLPYAGFTSEQIYDANVDCIRLYNFPDRATFQLEKIQAHPDIFILDLISYLEINPTAAQVEAAEKNIIKWS